MPRIVEIEHRRHVKNDLRYRLYGFKRHLNVTVSFQTSKKKLFVLRDESSSGPARLEYYDSAKKLASGGPPRRSVVLRNCFSINAKSDHPRHPFAIVLYTNDDCFVIGCDSDAERQDWLKALHELRRPGHCSASARSGSAFREFQIDLILLGLR